MLKAQAQAMTEQLGAINARIDELGRPSAGPALTAVVDSEKCNGCRICEQVCPYGAIVVDDVAEVDPRKCNGCGQCVVQCPRGAVSLRKA